MDEPDGKKDFLPKDGQKCPEIGTDAYYRLGGLSTYQQMAAAVAHGLDLSLPAEKYKSSDAHA